MLKPKNSVKQQHWMDSQLDVYLNPRPNLSMTRSMLNPLLSFEGSQGLGLVLIGNNGHGFTQAVELNWNFKIGIQVNPHLKRIILTITVSCGTRMGGGMIYRATTTMIISFVSFSNSCWILLWWCSDDGWKVFFMYMYTVNNHSPL